MPNKNRGLRSRKYAFAIDNWELCLIEEESTFHSATSS
jgi:hypothetical protein